MLFPSWGALLALFISIVLIIRKFPTFYALLIGALAGGFLSSFDLNFVVQEITNGTMAICPAILNVLAAGVLAGALIKSKSANKIALTVVERLGSGNALLALALSTFILTLSGVFIDIAVLTVAPIALAINSKSGISRMAMLIALIGGGKAGNVISPNPNTIAAAGNFNAPLTDVMYANIGAAIIGLIATLLILKIFKFKKDSQELNSFESGNIESEKLPHFFAAISGPLTAIGLLMLRPIFGIKIDPMIALIAGGLVCSIATFNLKKFIEFSKFGLEKMTGVAVLLLGTGCLAGIVKASNLTNDILSFMKYLNVSDIFIAPISGALMSAASASTTAGATIASATFGDAILASGVSAFWGAAMINAGATALDHLPHGSFFHVSGGSVGMSFSDRMKVIPFETAIGALIAAASTMSCWLALKFI